MPQACPVELYIESLLSGDRKACRQFISKQLEGVDYDASRVYQDLMWPAMEQIENLFRTDQINTAAEHMATRINRALVDQLQPWLKQSSRNGKSILITCADGEPEEMGAQMVGDMVEARGWQVHFLGGGVPNDEILALVGKLRPEVLLILGTQPSGVPQVRALVELIRSVGSNPTMNIVISGGVFNRADGLWKEVHADHFARTAREVLTLVEEIRPREPQIVILGAPKKRRRRRRPTLASTTNTK